MLGEEGESIMHNLGLMGTNIRNTFNLDTIYGFDIATDNLIEAFLTYSDVDNITIFNETLENKFDLSNIFFKKKINDIKQFNKKTTYNIVSELDVIQEAKNINIDVLHNVGSDNIHMLYYRECVSNKLVPITHTVHTNFDTLKNSEYIRFILLPNRPCDSIICTSNASVDATKEIIETLCDKINKVTNGNVKYTGRFDVIPLGIDLKTYYPRDKFECRKSYDIDNEEFVILWLGRLSAIDKADLYPLLLVTKKLIIDNPEKKIRLILSGTDREKWEYLPSLKNNIHNLNIESNVSIIMTPDINVRCCLYSLADVFVSPIDHIQETFGLTPLEAMACGLPQIVSNWDGYKDTVIDGHTGFHIPTYISDNINIDKRLSSFLPSNSSKRLILQGYLFSQNVVINIEKLESSIQKLIDDPLLKKKMSENSLLRIKENYSWNIIVSKYMKLWQELTDISKFETRCKLNYFDSVDLMKIWSSYPSDVITDETIVKITNYGNEFYNDSLKIEYDYKFVHNLQHDQYYKDILSHCKKNISINDIIKNYNRRERMIVNQAIIILIKKGFIKVVKIR